MRDFWRKNWVLLVVMALALILRWPYLTSSFWLDEAAQVLEVSTGWYQQLQPPLLHLIAFVAIQFSSQEWWLRLWAALLPGLLAIWGTYELGRKLSSKRVGLLAALLLTTSSLHIYFSQELGLYSFSILWTVWSWFFLLEALRVGQDSYQLSRGHYVDKIVGWLPIGRDMFLFLLMTILGCYTSYLYFFVVISQMVFLLVYRHYRYLLYTIIVPLVAFLPWIPSLITQLQINQVWSQSFPGWEYITSFSWWKAPTLTLGELLYGVVDLEFNIWYVSWTIIGLVLLLGVIFGHTRKFYKQNLDRWRLIVCMIIVPLVLAGLIAFVIPIVQPKRMIYLLPLIYVWLSFLIFGRRRDWRELNWASWGLLLWLLIFNLWGTGQYYRQYSYQRENWRHLITTLHQRYDSQTTVVVFAYASPFAPWQWYEQSYQHRFPTLSTGSYDTQRLDNLDQILAPVANYQVVIVFDYLRSLTDSNNLIIKTLTDMGWVEQKIITYPNIGFVRVFRPVSDMTLTLEKDW